MNGLGNGGHCLRSRLHRCRDSQDRRRNDDGLTLVELLIVIAILPLVAGALAVALIAVISQSNTASSKTTNSGDASVFSASYVPDVMGSSQVTTDPSVSSPPVCGGGTPVVSLQWGLSPTVVVSYTVQSQVQQGNQTASVLYRYECFGGSTTPSRSTVVVHKLQSGTLQATISGSSTTCSSTGCAQGAAKNSWISTEGVSGISVTVNAPESTTAFNYTLTGVPRASSNASRNSTPPGNPDPLVVVKSTGQVNCGNATLVVDGGAQIQSSATPALSTGPQGSITATGSISTEPGATTSGNVTPTPTGTLSNPLDPYGNITPPSTTGLPTWGDGNPNHGPGIYTAGISFSGTVSLQSGVYIVQGGVSGSGNLHVTNASGGVLFYIESGGWTVNGGSQTSQNLTAWNSPFSPAPNLLIWEAKGDTSAINLGGGTNDSYGGVVYSPSGTVSSNGGVGMTVSDIVAGNVQCGNGASGGWTITGSS